MAEENPGQPAPAAPEPAPAPEPKAAPEPSPEPAKADPPKPASVLENPGDDPGPGPATWPDNWRDIMAGDDAKLKKRLERFTSPNDVWKSFHSLESKFKQGAVTEPTPFPAEGTPEEQQAWRKENGIPEKPVEYIGADYTLDEGLVIGEADRPYVDEWLAQAHSRNEKPEAVKAALNDYFKLRDKQIQEIAKRDKDDEVQTTVELREEMGKDYARYLTAALTLVQSAPEDVQANILNARLANGKKLGNDPGTLRWLTRLALEVNPAATVVPAGGAEGQKGVEARISEIESLMRTDRKKYESKEIQDEYDTLLKAREKINARNKAA